MAEEPGGERNGRSAVRATIPPCPPPLREGAAVALSKNLSQSNRARVRIAASDGPPALRDALARACDGADDEALAEALAALGPAPRRKARQ